MYSLVFLRDGTWGIIEKPDDMPDWQVLLDIKNQKVVLFERGQTSVQYIRLMHSARVIRRANVISRDMYFAYTNWPYYVYWSDIGPFDDELVETYYERFRWFEPRHAAFFDYCEL